MISDDAYVMQIDSTEEAEIEQPVVSQEINSVEESDSEHLDSQVPSEQTPQTNHRLNASDADDGQLCPICLDSWTSSGNHRICALKCGHLFGYSCITYWFNSQREKNCPTCKKKSSRSEIRFIYARKLVVVDNSEVESIKKQLDNVVEDKSRVQLELTRAIVREHSLKCKVEELERKIDGLKKSLEVMQQVGKCSQPKDGENYNKMTLYIDKSLEMCKESGCRVLNYCSRNNLVVASMKSPNMLFPGYGVRYINAALYKPTAYVPLHVKPIRDLKFHSQRAWLLSVSLDNLAKIIDTYSSRTMFFYKSDVPLWSCCWDTNNSYIIYLGQQKGDAVKLDIRKMSEPICKLEVPGDMSPVISIGSIEPSELAPNGGVIVCKLNSLWAFEANNEEYSQYLLPIDGPFVSMNFESNTKQLLVTTRPNSQNAYSRHHLCYLDKDRETNNLVSRTVHCLQGSTSQKFLSRSNFVTYHSDYYIAAHQESNKSVYLWNVNTGNKESYIPAPEPVLDLCGFNAQNTDFMVSLTEKKLIFYKFAQN